MLRKLPDSIELKAWLRRVLRPKTKLGKTTLWFGGLALLLELLRLITRSPAGTMLSGWANFVLYIFIVCGLLMGLRWLRLRLLWRVRNRLIVTYTFIGVIPVILLVAMGLIAGYLFAGQFATYVASAELQGEVQHLESANTSLAVQLRNLARNGAMTVPLASEIASASAENFRRRTVTVWEGDRGFVVPPERQGIEARPIKVPSEIKGNFSGIVLDGKRLHLRAVRRLEEGGRHFTVVSNVPLTTEVLRSAASQLGSLTILPPESESSDATVSQPSNAGGLPPATAAMHPAASVPSRLSVGIGGTRSTVSLSTEGGRVEAGRVPPAANSFDFQFPFATRFGTIEWQSGKTLDGLMLVDTRPSMLYAALFSTLGEKSKIFVDLLTGIAIFFGLIELVALVIGMRLTRSITKSVADLYDATGHINRGDLSHRITVRTNDQMAALEQSFNSMTASLSRLIAEQKEKQRLEGELAIAHEVQNLLFPADLSGLPTLEVHGTCRPARTVSGDYYDFIPLREDKLMLAVGDISGKGISAALLMATVHAFVRAYSLEPERTLASVALGAGGRESSILAMYGVGGNGNSGLTPGVLMATLNYQLYRSTPTEKYATMFVGCYHAGSQTLTYSNAGHLPPLVLHGRDQIRRLETSDTVVGLFDGIQYHESTVAMETGDIFVAYSDGITEPENEFGEFGEERLIQLIQENRHQPLARISDIVTSAVSDWIAGGEQPDDVTLVLARAR
jgi:sigma-B regulation protein RsbU (phosphoserine phosphatase)